MLLHKKNESKKYRYNIDKNKKIELLKITKFTFNVST